MLLKGYFIDNKTTTENTPLTKILETNKQTTPQNLDTYDKLCLSLTQHVKTGSSSSDLWRARGGH